MENILQLNWKQWNICSDGPKQEATVSSAPFFELFRLSMGCETFPSKLELKVRDRITIRSLSNRQLRPKGASVQLGDPAHLSYISALHYQTVERSQTAQAASLPSNWPDLSPHRRSLLGIWRHLTEAHLQISSSFSIQSIPFDLLDIKTYGSHYLQIGCKGRRRHREKGRSGQNITNCIRAIQKMRRHGAEVGWCHPNGDRSIMGRMSHFVQLSSCGW